MAQKRNTHLLKLVLRFIENKLIFLILNFPLNQVDLKKKAPRKHGRSKNHYRFKRWWSLDRVFPRRCPTKDWKRDGNVFLYNIQKMASRSALLGRKMSHSRCKFLQRSYMARNEAGSDFCSLLYKEQEGKKCFFEFKGNRMFPIDPILFGSGAHNYYECSFLPLTSLYIPPSPCFMKHDDSNAFSSFSYMGE